MMGFYAILVWNDHSIEMESVRTFMLLMKNVGVSKCVKLGHVSTES